MKFPPNPGDPDATNVAKSTILFATIVPAPAKVRLIFSNIFCSFTFRSASRGFIALAFSSISFSSISLS